VTPDEKIAELEEKLRIASAAVADGDAMYRAAKAEVERQGRHIDALHLVRVQAAAVLAWMTRPTDKRVGGKKRDVADLGAIGIKLGLALAQAHECDGWLPCDEREKSDAHPH